MTNQNKFTLFGDDYDTVDTVSTRTTSTHDVKLTVDQIFITHDMINIILYIKQLKRIKNIKLIHEEQITDIVNINETYDIPQRLDDYQFDQNKYRIINVFKIKWLLNNKKRWGATTIIRPNTT